MTIPILAEGFKNIISGRLVAPENFDCFKDFTSSFVTTQLLAIDLFEEFISFRRQKSFLRLLQDASKVINRSISPTQYQV